MDPKELVKDAQYTIQLDNNQVEVIFLFSSLNYYNFLTDKGILQMSHTKFKNTICKINGTNTGNSSKNATAS